jgi:hypothetical protein
MHESSDLESYYVSVLLYDYLKPDTGIIYAAIVVGIIAFGLAIYSTLTISETHNTDMDFVE